MAGAKEKVFFIFFQLRGNKSHKKASVRTLILFEHPKKRNRNRFSLGPQSKSTYLTISRARAGLVRACQSVNVCDVNCIAHVSSVEVAFPPVNI